MHKNRVADSHQPSANFGLGIQTSHCGNTFGGSFRRMMGFVTTWPPGRPNHGPQLEYIRGAETADEGSLGAFEGFTEVG